MKKNINADFKALLTDQFISDIAENHREAWRERMSTQTKSEVKFDLDVNHDDISEIECAEQKLNRELTDDERESLIKRFHSEVVRQHKKTVYHSREY